MENHKLVLPEHLNQYGYLFGGHLLQWVDEYAWIAATIEFPGCTFVTVGMDKVEFKRSVKEGTILKFIVDKTRRGHTSLQYRVNVYCHDQREDKDLVFSVNVTFVRIDQQGNKLPLPYKQV
ncbi:acyl-CoA thioesterase [bacterium]|nr:acyl-CoA thioesterase [bacterium]